MLSSAWEIKRKQFKGFFNIIYVKTIILTIDLAVHLNSLKGKDTK